MDNKLRTDILEVLKHHDHVVYLSGVTERLVDVHKHQSSDDFTKQVRDYLRILGDSGYVLIRENGGAGSTVSTYCLTEEGYAQLAPWYVKSWKFFTNDLAKILSVVSLLLSIVATTISLLK